MGHAPAHDQERDQTQDDHQHREADRVQPGQVPQLLVDVRGVLEDHEDATSPLIVHQRDGVVVRLPVAQVMEPLLGRDFGERQRDGREGCSQGGGPVGAHRDQRSGAVVDGDAPRGGAEALDDPLDLRPGAAIEQRLDGFLESLAEEPGAPLELGGQTGALTVHRDVCERPEDENDRQPNGCQQAQI